MENNYDEELSKFVKKEVEVIDADGKKYEGTCWAVNYHFLNIVLMTDKDKIIIRNIKSIRRQRTSKVGEQ